MILRQGLRAALTPVVSQLGTSVGALLGGVIRGGAGVQPARPGLRLGERDQHRNLAVIIGFVIVASAFAVIASILAGLACALLDPRVRIS